MAMTRWDPVSELRSLTHRVERVLGVVSHLMTPSERPQQDLGEPWPLIDVYEDMEEVVVRAEVPGVEPKDVEVVLDDATLTLRGQRRRVREGERENYQHVESMYGAFSRCWTLPGTVDRDKIRAELKSGILEVHAPKREGAGGKTIPIQT